MNTKKATLAVYAASLAILTMSSFGIAAQAAPITEPGDTNVPVSGTITESYEVVLPASYVLAGATPGASSTYVGESNNISITKATVETGKSVYLKLKTGNTNLEIAHNSVTSNKAAFELQKDSDAALSKSNGQTLLEAKAGDATQKATLKARFAGGTVPSTVITGAYSGNVTFSVSVATSSV